MFCYCVECVLTRCDGAFLYRASLNKDCGSVVGFLIGFFLFGLFIIINPTPISRWLATSVSFVSQLTQGYVRTFSWSLENIEKTQSNWNKLCFSLRTTCQVGVVFFPFFWVYLCFSDFLNLVLCWATVASTAKEISPTLPPNLAWVKEVFCKVSVPLRTVVTEGEELQIYCKESHLQLLSSVWIEQKSLSRQIYKSIFMLPAVVCFVISECVMFELLSGKWRRWT